MSFYIHDPQMDTFVCELIDRFAKDGRSNLHNNIALTWIVYKDLNPAPFSGIGTGFSEHRLMYPASVIKLFYGCAIETWLHKDLLFESKELKRAMDEMICKDYKRYQMGANGIKFVEKNYSWKKSKEIMLNSYNKILNDEI